MREPVRAFGFSWMPEVDTYKLRDELHGDVSWVSLEDSGDGGEFVVFHVEETGEFDLIEFGGAGPSTWDQEHGTFDSPLRAMLAARRIFNGRMADYEAWDRLWDKERRWRDENRSAESG